MNPAATYRDQQATGWCRIDMLLALYDSAIDALSGANEALQDRNESRMTADLVRAQKLVIGIVAGIDPNGGPIAENILGLCAFVARCINERRPHPAISVLKPIRDALLEIRDEAASLEQRGTIPSIHAQADLEFTA